MSTEVLSPELVRLRQEVVRAVKIAYSDGFSSTDDKRALASIAAITLGANPQVKKSIAEFRLKSPGLGEFRCPRVVRDPKTGKSTKIHQNSDENVSRYPGVCQEEIDPANPGSICGRKLEPMDTHLAEFAEGFGFLENSGAHYIWGKFGLVGKYLSEVEEQKKNYFDYDRARRGLYLHSLLERHADIVLPVLWKLKQSPVLGSSWNDDVIKIFRNNLARKTELMKRSSIPASNQATFHIRTILRDTSFVFRNLDDRSRVLPIPLSQKTRDFYVTKTRNFLVDLEIIANTRRDGKGTYNLTQSGMDLVSALEAEGVLVTEDTCYFPPSFEAMHDTFSLRYDRYEETFTPILSNQILERIVTKTLLPTAKIQSWKTNKFEIEHWLPQAIRSMSSYASARVDTLRLALYLHQIGRGQPIELEESDDITADTSNPNSNAIVQVAMDHPQTFIAGHAKSGRRLWSITLTRRG